MLHRSVGASVRCLWVILVLTGFCVRLAAASHLLNLDQGVVYAAGIDHPARCLETDRGSEPRRNRSRFSFQPSTGSPVARPPNIRSVPANPGELSNRVT